KRQAFDVVLLDMRLPDGDGLDLLTRFQELAPEIQVVIITAFVDVDNAVQAMKLGAYDYITKPFDLDRLEMVIEKAFQRASLQRENRLLRHSQAEERPIKLIGQSKKMDQVRYLIRKVSPTQVPVLLTGESGTGKTVVARSIHDLSPRSQTPMIIKNCATLHKDLVRSELFGHRKGAFTGADQSREGLLTFAHKGTLFLDEIGELSVNVQGALLRVLETQTFRRVGDKDEQHVDVRFIFATNKDLRAEVEAGRFSDALYHRLNVFNIPLPSLRERREDIPALVEYFLGPLGADESRPRIAQRAMRCLLSYNWPGNVRELQNVLERGMILSEQNLITEKSLPLDLVVTLDQGSSDRPFQTLQEIEREHILKVLDYVNGHKTKAAKILGIGRKTLYRKIQELNLVP
ncbi:MAG: sigma-54 dependent transcriptional regulator, partial [Deltaproteobacteria bacterium]|nr:sigma-54 dependent transcriptional regulator [Deltaproteobacteria bacterium]